MSDRNDTAIELVIRAVRKLTYAVPDLLRSGDPAQPGTTTEGSEGA